MHIGTCFTPVGVALGGADALFLELIVPEDDEVCLGVYDILRIYSSVMVYMIRAIFAAHLIPHTFFLESDH